MPDKRLIYGMVILFVINLLQAFFTPISEDEAYYWVWSQNLDWGYFDHPPMVAWWISVGYNLFQNELGVRLLTVFFNSFSLYFLWEILRPKSLSQIKLFFGIISSLLVFQIFGFLSTPDAPLLFFTIFYLFSLKKFLEENSNEATLLLAVSLAGLMYSKYHGILLILFSILPIFKFYWRNPKFYLAVLGSLILYLPHFIWLFQNDFIPVRYHFLERSADEHFEFRKLFNYLGIYFLGCAPFLSYFIWKAIFRFKAENPFQKSIFWLCILSGIFFFFSIFKDNVQPQWLLISFVPMGLMVYFYYRNQENLKWVWNLSLTGTFVVLVLRILLILSGISPFEKNKNFAESVEKFSPELAVFEKYQEASVYNFYNPERKVAVHRTLGNRKSQFTLWNWEEDFYGKNVVYISPWIKSNKSFIGYKNRDYFLKEIQNYQTYELIEIKTIKELSVKPNEEIHLKVKIRNGQQHPIKIGGNSELKLNISYYKDLQYEILYSSEIKTDKFTLQPDEEKELEIQFKNTPKTGQFKACLGVNYSQAGTTYLSNIINLSIE